VFAWLGTLWQGRPELKLPMLYLIGFFVVFVLGGLTGVMLAMVPFDAQAHDTAFVTAHLHYVLVGGFVFPMLAAAYYWLPHITGRERVMRIGEAAFWLIFIGFNLTFFMMHLTGLLGMPRRIDTYPEGMGWTWLNLLSSVGGFLQAFGFALVVIDVALQVWLGRNHRRNPWGATTLEWAMPIPSPDYNFASLPSVDSRDPLGDDPDLGVKLARGDGYLADASRNQRETIAVDMTSGKPEHVAILPGNSWWPIVTAAIIGGFFLSMLAGLYVIAPIFIVGTAWAGWRWAWTNGTRGDVGPLPIGDGTTLPTSFEVARTTGWWGSVFAIAASATLFAALLFGYAFLWTVAPNWPPPRLIAPSLLPPLIAVAGGAVAFVGSRSGRAPLMLGGQIAIVAALLLLLMGAPDPKSHAYAATSAALASYAIFHAALAALIAAFVMARARAGYHSASRINEGRIARLWSDHGAGAGAFVAILLVLPGWLA